MDFHLCLRLDSSVQLAQQATTRYPLHILGIYAIFRMHCAIWECVYIIHHAKVYLSSPGPSEIGHNPFISQPILKLLRSVDSS